MFDAVRRIFAALGGAAANAERLRDNLGELADTAGEINAGVRERLGMQGPKEVPALESKVRVKSR